MRMEAAISDDRWWAGFVHANVGFHHLWKCLSQGHRLMWLKEASLVGSSSLFLCWVWLGWSWFSSWQTVMCCVLVLWIKQHTSVFTTAEKCLHSFKAFYFLPSVSRVSSFGVGKKPQRDIATTADSDLPMRHLISQDVMLSNKFQWKELKKGTFVVLMFVFQVRCYLCWGPTFQGVTGHLDYPWQVVN